MLSQHNKIEGKEIAREIVEGLKKRERPEKFLAAFLVGEDPASLSFLKKKEQIADELGIEFRLYQLLPSVGVIQVREEVMCVQEEEDCGGVLVQLPLATHLGAHDILNAIDVAKDVDVLGESARGVFYNGDSVILPPAVSVVEEICARQNVELAKARVAVLGVGFLIGKPIATWLMGRVKELTVLTRKSDLLDSACGLHSADLVVTGAGSPGVIYPNMLKEGAGVIDFGTAIVGGKLRGDLDIVSGETSKLSFYTPTSGGTGPILVAKLFENFYTLNDRHYDVS
ncbi:MAG: bifunctional 5,10-methylenetetrahydrofolate dehydrogenase/5,10-methenyltetrahydrofolate cyclohydrolase [Parcubacteria group bacterium]|nr:bifunctional 5,10-methylenetetrahydrofolate dehydrogenase/5,10-methenyltetrahydrofolate cyclohydrolase [Parcubacteria group bacterium]